MLFHPAHVPPLKDPLDLCSATWGSASGEELALTIHAEETIPPPSVPLPFSLSVGLASPLGVGKVPLLGKLWGGLGRG